MSHLDLIHHLAALVMKWDRQDRASRKESADMNARLQRGETVNVTTTTGGKWLHEKRVDELRELIKAATKRQPDKEAGK